MKYTLKLLKNSLHLRILKKIQFLQEKKSKDSVYFILNIKSLFLPRNPFSLSEWILNVFLQHYP